MEYLETIIEYLTELFSDFNLESITDLFSSLSSVVNWITEIVELIVTFIS